MAYNAPSTRSTGDLCTAAIWNADVVANEIAIYAGALSVTSQAVGDILYASSTTQFARVGIGSANKVLTSSGSAPQWSTQLVNAALPTNIDVGGTLDVTGATTLDSTLAVVGAVTFNDAGADVDFRVESDDNANMLFVDGGNDRVGIGTATVDAMLHVEGSSPDIKVEHTGGRNILLSARSGKAYIGDNLGERFTLQTGETVINEDGNDFNFRVEGDTDSHLMFCDSGLEKVGISTSAPLDKLDLSADSNDSGFTISSTSASYSQPTTGYAPAKTVLRCRAQSYTDGGAYIQGFTDSSAYQSIVIAGIAVAGVAATTAIIECSAAMNNGGVGVTSIDDLDCAFAVTNNGPKLLAVYGSGNTGVGAIGNTTPDGTLHVFTASAGSVTASGDKSDLIVENNSHGGISILTPDAYEAGLFTGHASDNRVGEFYTKYSDNLMTIGSSKSGMDVRFQSGAAVEAMRIGSSGHVIIGHTASVTADVASTLQVLGTGQADSSFHVGRWGANASPAQVTFIKSRHGTIPSNTIVADNDVVGELRWVPADGVDLATRAATFGAEVDDASPAAGDIGMAFVWDQMPGGGGAIRETMRLSASGNLHLDVGYMVLSLAGTNNENIEDKVVIRRNDGTLISETLTYNPALDTLSIGTNAIVIGGTTIRNSSGTLSVKVADDSSALLLNQAGGNVGIGTTSPAALLELDQGAADTAILTFVSSDVNQPMTGSWPADTFGSFGKASGNLGGLSIAGLSDHDGGSGIDIKGAVGGTSPSVAGIILNGFKSAGGTGGAAMTGTEPVLVVKTDSVELMRLTGAGNLGIGTTSPDVLTHISGSNVVIGNTANALLITSTDSYAIDKGGGISFAGSYTGSSPITWTSIAGRKENATDGNYAGYLQFATRAQGGDVAEKMRLTSAGLVGIGTTSPASALHVTTAVAAAGTHMKGIQLSPTVTGATGGWEIYGVQVSPTIVESSDGSNPHGNIIGMLISPTITNGTAVTTAATALHVAAFTAATGTVTATGLRVYAPTSATNNVGIYTNGSVGIGKTDPATLLHVYGTSSPAVIQVEGSGTVNTAFRLRDANHYWDIYQNGSTNSIGFWNVSAGEVLTLTSAGGFVWNEAGLAQDFRLESDTNVDMFFLDGSANSIGIGTSTPNALLQLESTGDGAATLEVRCTVTPNGSKYGGYLTLGLHQGNDSGSGANETQAGDTLGQIVFKGQGYDYTYQGGRIACGVQTGASNNTRVQQGTYLSFSTINTSSDSYAERMRIDQDGNVGINQTTPTHKLHVVGDIKLQNSQIQLTNGYGLMWGTTGLYAYADTNYIRFDVGGAQAMRIISSGNIGIGTSAPGARLEIEDGGIAHPGPLLIVRQDTDDVWNTVLCNDAYSTTALHGARTGVGTSGNYYFYAPDKGSSPGDFLFYTDEAERLRITSAGSVGIGQASPEGRLHVDQGGSSDTQITFGHPYTSGGSTIAHIARNDGDYEIINYATGGDIQFKLQADRSVAIDRNLKVTGYAQITGTLTKGDGTFKIDHPLPAKTNTHHLLHSFIEGPRADLIYRGTETLIAGSATVDLDTASGMTAGTWVLLCRDEQCFTSNETGWFHVRGSVTGSTLTIDCEETDCTDTVSWMVVASRKDQRIMDTDWTDDDGYPLLEPLKPEEPPVSPSASPSE